MRRIKRAQILLAADGGGAATIARVVVVGTATVYRAKQRFVGEGGPAGPWPCETRGSWRTRALIDSMYPDKGVQW